MKKSFNTTGICNPKRHYMVDTSEKLSKIISLIEQGKYFTINRARQFGKTTTLFALNNALKEDYYIIKTSFEVTDESMFSSNKNFCERICYKLANTNTLPQTLSAFWENAIAENFDSLSKTISTFCKDCDKPVILMIDEVDKSLDNQLFLNFLGMLRNLYLERENRDDYEHFTFFSVILAGVYDVKNLKIKLRPDEERKYNSPWNIAVDFKVDMSFSAAEIKTMLDDYESDYITGMDTEHIAQQIHKFTSGYPFLVSKICELIHEDFNQDWTENGIKEAIKEMLYATEPNTLFKSIGQNLLNNSDFDNFIKNISLNSIDYPFSTIDPTIELGLTFSIIKFSDNKIKIHNIIFEDLIYNFYISRELQKNSGSIRQDFASYVINNKLNMDVVIKRFQNLIRKEYRKEDDKFLEQQGRLLFLCFLKPIINGSGFYYVEPQTRENNRMDLVVTYGGEEFIIELKIWRGEKYETEGKVQLAGYLNTRGLDKGYLVTFSFLKDKAIQEEPVWIKHDGKDIFEAII